MRSVIAMRSYFLDSIACLGVDGILTRPRYLFDLPRKISFPYLLISPKMHVRFFFIFFSTLIIYLFFQVEFLHSYPLSINVAIRIYLFAHSNKFPSNPFNTYLLKLNTLNFFFITYEILE